MMTSSKIECERVTGSDAETIAVGRTLSASLKGGDVVAIDGPLGAGKTCFVRGLVHGLGLDPRQVSSPTFVLCQEYDRPAPPADTPTTRATDDDGHQSSSPVLRVAHIDAYRLSSPEELETIGYDELLADPAMIVVIEWADRIRDAVPGTAVHVRIDHIDNDRRRIVIDRWR